MKSNKISFQTTMIWNKKGRKLETWNVCGNSKFLRTIGQRNKFKKIFKLTMKTKQTKTYWI